VYTRFIWALKRTQVDHQVFQCRTYIKPLNKLGTNLDPEEVEGWGKKKKNEVWVCGVAYAPAFHVRKFNKEKMRQGYLFHTE
jgi:hypothetical protein